MAEIAEDEKKELFRRVRNRLGAPLRKVEIPDEAMNTLLQDSIDDYSERINEWLTEDRWENLASQNLNKTDITRALTTRSLDYETQFTFAYSKQQGLQTRGPWVLKKDFVELKQGQQVYEIPPNREINEILWITPPSLHRHLVDPFVGVWNFQFGAGFGGAAGYGGGGFGGFGSYHLMPAYDVLQRAADWNLKSRIIRSELTYKVTAGPDGKKFLHLFPVPGGRFDFGAFNFESSNIDGFRVWYYYYETDGDREKCLEENKDIIKTPADVPIDRLQYNDLNSFSKNWVRKYLIAIAKEYLGRVRGKFTGELPTPNVEATMDYSELLGEAEKEKEQLMEKLDERLQRLTRSAMLEKRAQDAENLNTALQYRPMQIFVR